MKEMETLETLAAVIVKISPMPKLFQAHFRLQFYLGNIKIRQILQTYLEEYFWDLPQY